MGHPNEDLVRQGYDAFSRGDMDTLRQLFHTLVFHVRDGKVTEVWQYWSDQYAADEVFG